MLSEISPKIVEKLTKFVIQFENYYDEELKLWKGDHTVSNFDRIKSWIYEYFR